VTRRASLVAAWAWLVTAHVAAQANSAAQDAVGFGDPAPQPPAASDALGFGDAPRPAAARVAEPAPFQLGLSLAWQSALRVTSDRPRRIAKLRQVLAAYAQYSQDSGALRFTARIAGRSEVDFEYLMHAADYDPASYQQYAWQLHWGESYLALDLSGLELRVGQQVVSFGQGEMLSVLDVVNPRDLREPLLTDPSELRLPLLMTQLGFTQGSLRTQLLVVHEPYFGLSAPPLGEWSPLRKLLLENRALGPALGDRALRNRHEPAQWPLDPAATQLHGRLTWSGPGVDLTLSAGSMLDALGVPSLPPPSAFNGALIDMPIHHPRYASFGHSGAWTLGAFVVRWEAAFDHQHPLTARRTDSALPSWFALRRHQLQGMLGVLYAPGVSTSAALEVAQTYVLDNPGRSRELRVAPLFPVEATRLALRFNHSFWSDRCNVSFLLLRIGGQALNAWAARAELGVKLLDAVEVSLGFITYQPTSRFGFFYGFERHERAYLNVRWDVSR